MTTLFPMKYSLFDLLVAITIAAIFAAVTPAWLRHVIEASSIQDAEFADPGFELRREKRIAVYAPLLSLLMQPPLAVVGSHSGLPRRIRLG